MMLKAIDYITLFLLKVTNTELLKLKDTASENGVMLEL